MGFEEDEEEEKIEGRRRRGMGPGFLADGEEEEMAVGD